MRNGVAALVIVVAIVAAYRWWASDERAIRRQLSTIADALTAARGEGSLGQVTRVAMLRKTLSADVRVSADPSGAPHAAGDRPAQELVGRDIVLGAVSRWIPPPGGITVEFRDVQVMLSDDRSAQVTCTARLTSSEGSDAPTIDERELILGFTKIDGTWLVSAVAMGNG